MTAEEVLSKYCAVCQHKKKCYKPCIFALRNLYDTDIC